MLIRLFQLFGFGKSRLRPVERVSKISLIVTEDCLHGIKECVEAEIAKKHEGIAYLLGTTDGISTLVVGAMRPNAQTNRGSFHVGSVAMAKVVREVASTGLQMVGQIHTHPRMAYHSDGDVEGARLAYPGFVSIVVPDYGVHLPRLNGAAVYFFKKDHGFVQLSGNDVRVVARRLG